MTEPAPPSPAGILGTDGAETPAERSGIFRNRDFVLFFAGQLVSNAGTWLHNVAQGVFVLNLTGSPLAVGATSAALFIPVLMLAPIGGQLADRFDRRRLMIVAQCCAFAASTTLVVLVMTGQATVLAISIVAMIVGLQAAVFTPTMGALLPSLVDPAHLGQAIGLNSATYNAARAVGPIMATIAIGTLGFGFTFGLNAISYLFLIAALLSIRVREKQETRVPGRVRDGLGFVWREPRLRLMLLGVIAVSMAADPVLTLAPVFAVEYGQRAADAGLLVTVFGAGSVAAAAALAWIFRSPARRRSRMLAVGISLFATGLVGFALSPLMSIGLMGLFVAGAGFLASNTSLTTEVLETTPAVYRGRVMGLWTVCFLGTRPIAALADGVLADAVGVRVTPLVFVVPLLVVGLLAARRLAARRG